MEDKTTFELSGMNKDKERIKHLGSNPTTEQLKRHIRDNVDLKAVLACPLGVTNFIKFLQYESNLENLMCYLAAKSLEDHLKLTRTALLSREERRQLGLNSETATLDELDDEDENDFTLEDDESTSSSISSSYNPHSPRSPLNSTNTRSASNNNSNDHNQGTSNNNTTFDGSKGTDELSSRSDNGGNSLRKSRDDFQQQDLNSGGSEHTQPSKRSTSRNSGTNPRTSSGSNRGSTDQFMSSSKHGGGGAAAKTQNEKMRKYVDQVVARVKHFFSSYIVESAQHEINIDHKLRNEMEQLYKRLLSVRTELTVALAGFGHQSSTFNMFFFEVEFKAQLDEMIQLLDNLLTQLLINLRDPFLRFKDHPLLMEALTLFVTGNTDEHRKQLMSANKGGVVLNVSNNGNLGVATVESPLTVASQLLTSLLGAISDTSLWMWSDELGRIVFDHDHLAKAPHKPWRLFQDGSIDLKHVDLSQLENENESLAFWINVYNMLIIHATLVAQGMPDQQISRELFFRKSKYNVGGHEFSLEDIREGVLFGNHVRNMMIGRQFKPSDPRKKYTMKKPTYTVLFALSDLTLQSPMVEVMDYERVYDQLDHLTMVYLNNNITVLPDGKVVAPALLLDRKALLKEFLKSNEQPSMSHTDAATWFVREYASHFRMEQHENDTVIFKDTNRPITNLACSLNHRDLEVITKVKKASWEEEQKMKEATEGKTRKDAGPVTSHDGQEQQPRPDDGDGEVAAAVNENDADDDDDSSQGPNARIKYAKKDKVGCKCTIM